MAYEKKNPNTNNSEILMDFGDLIVKEYHPNVVWDEGQDGNLKYRDEALVYVDMKNEEDNKRQANFPFKIEAYSFDAKEILRRAAEPLTNPEFKGKTPVLSNLLEASGRKVTKPTRLNKETGEQEPNPWYGKTRVYYRLTRSLRSNPIAGAPKGLRASIKKAISKETGEEIRIPQPKASVRGLVFPGEKNHGVFSYTDAKGKAHDGRWFRISANNIHMTKFFDEERIKGNEEIAKIFDYLDNPDGKSPLLVSYFDDMNFSYDHPYNKEINAVDKTQERTELKLNSSRDYGFCSFRRNPVEEAKVEESVSEEEAPASPAPGM